MPDVDISCIQCREIFVFTEREQEDFYRLNQMPPQRCTKCRPSRRKLAEAKASGQANNSNRYEIVCDRCGKKDSVPFAPKIGRTVLCSDCYGASRVARTRG